MWNRVGSVFTTVHELGHALGLAHSARQGETYGAWRWSRGHYVTPRGEAERHGTIMAYGARILGGVFSDPMADCGSGPCGVSADELDGADSVTTLDLLRFQIGAHREPAVDTDGDGFVDAADAAPDDPGDWFDLDGDGIGDNADPDDDNDGTADADDAFPVDPEEWVDADLDGVGDNADDDVQDLSPFRDPALRAAVENALGKEAGAPITPEDMAPLTELQAQGFGIRDLSGLELATGLEKLWLGSNRIGDLSPLSELPSLQLLVVYSNEIADLSPLTGLATLRQIGLSRNRISDISPLSMLAKLWSIRLDDNPIEDISPLAGLNGVGYLYLNNTRVVVADVLALPYWSRLRGIGLRGFGIDDISALAAVPHLWSLELDDNAVTDIGPLADLNELGRLTLSSNRISDVTPLAAKTALKGLNLRDNRVSDITPLAGMVELESLYLAGNRISNASPLSAMTALKWLDLRENDVADITPLAAMVELESLFLADNRVSDVSALEGLVVLKHLNLSNNRIADVSPLAAMTALISLNLRENRVTDITPLAGMVELESLFLADNRISDVSALEGLVVLKHLNLSNNRVANVSPLSTITMLRSLSLTNNAVSDIGPLAARSIFGGAGSAGASVNLDGNPLDDTSVREHIPTLKSWGIVVRFTRRGSKVAATAMDDPTLRALVAEALAYAGLHVDDDMSEWPIDQLKRLSLYGRGVANLAGLDAANGLESLHAASNRISDLSPLAGLADLSKVDLRDNRVSDISPLVANAGLADGDWVVLDGNPLSEDSLNTHVPALIERGVVVSVGSIALSLVAGGEPLRYDVSGYFEAVLGVDVKMTARVEDMSLATAEVTDGALVVAPGARAGRVVVTVEATDGRGAVETLTFVVRVRGPWQVPLFPNASDTRQGFVRVVNHGHKAGDVRITAIDDAGARKGPLRLAIGPREAVHFNSADLEAGNPDKGLAGSSGRGTGDWRLELESVLELEVLSYIRTPDGFLTAMHDVVSLTETGYRVPIFNPASNVDQVSMLRLTNLGSKDAEVVISGIDDHGQSPESGVVADVQAGATLLLNAETLEVGGSGLRGKLGDGGGKWRLKVISDDDLSVMNLLASPGSFLTNLSTSAPTALDEGGINAVPLFPSAADALGRQGFVRIINRSGAQGDVRIQPYDDTGRRYDALTLALDAGQTAHFNSDDLELGNPAKGISGSTGSGMGDWRMELLSKIDIEVLAYIRTPEGFLTSMHDVVLQAGRRHDVATFNPGSNTSQASLLRVVNPSARPAHVSVGGIDDAGTSSGDVVRVTIPARAGLVLTAAQLEGQDDADDELRARGAMGDGRGKWRLQVDSEQPVFVMSLLASQTGHLTNLSTSPVQ